MRGRANFLPRLLGLLALCGLGAVLGSAVTFSSSLQPPPGEGTVYVTQVEAAPNGAILKPLDLGRGLFSPIVRGLSFPTALLCGPDGRLYVNDLWAERGGLLLHRIWRFNPDGSGQTPVAEWASGELRPGAMAFSPNGDLYFGTLSTEAGRLTGGIWRIPGALHADRAFNPPEPVLPPEAFTPPPAATAGAVAEPYAFLTAGPFAGDLLIIDDPFTFGRLGGGENPGARVLRAPAPDFTAVEEFIPFHRDLETEGPFSAAGLAVTDQGDVLVTDIDNGKVLRYGPDGAFQGVFAQVEDPNQIAIGPDDLVYVTNVTFPGGGAVRGGLFIFDAEGKEVAKAEFAMRLRGVTVCAP